MGAASEDELFQNKVYTGPPLQSIYILITHQTHKHVFTSILLPTDVSDVLL